MSALLNQFGLTLMVNHACNLRCSYCYTGAKFSAPMNWETGATAIERACRSVEPGGHLDLGFFGGEPLLESARILEWMSHARNCVDQSGQKLRFNLTTNGTIAHNDAWKVMMAEDMDLAVSFDGFAEIHNRHRRDTVGRETASMVEGTLRRLLDSDKPVRVNVVVRPDNLQSLPAGLVYLHNFGIREINLSLDLWAVWSAADGRCLEQFVGRAGELWRAWLPEFSLNWFDARAGDLAGLPTSEETTRCGFGDGEIAVAPSGRLYPCERLIGEDRPGHPLCLSGHVRDGTDFLDFSPGLFQTHAACSRCALASTCDTLCRCSNFVRTGDVNRPDGLLCLLNKATARITGQMLSQAVSIVPDAFANKRSSYV